jgi:hypothetical protein
MFGSRQPQQERNMETSHMHRPILAAMAAVAILPLAVLAQSTSPQAPSAAAPSSDQREARSAVRAACAADVQKFCANIERARGAMRSCLEQHENDLSASCKAARAERAAERAKSKG